MANGNGTNLGFEERLWTAADKLRGTMDASEYKHVEHISKFKTKTLATLKIRMNTWQRTYSGCRRKLAGGNYAITPKTRALAA